MSKQNAHRVHFNFKNTLSASFVKATIGALQAGHFKDIGRHLKVWRL
jgi:hypothetical protein